MTHTPQDLERLLWLARPSPRAEFVRQLEHSLVPARARRTYPPLRVAIAAAGLATGLAALAIALSVAGVLPIQLGGGDRAQAEHDCRPILLEREQRIPSFVRGPDGRFEVRYDVRVVPRFVRPCR